jgi:flagellar hook-length control protein FliK
LLSQKTTVKDEQTVGGEEEKSDLPSQSENLFGEDLPQQSLDHIGEQIGQEKKGVSSNTTNAPLESVKAQKIEDGSPTQTVTASVGIEANQASAELQNQAILAEEVNLAIPTVDSRVAQSEELKSDRNISNLFEKLILARALNQTSEELATMPQGQILMEQNLQNLMKSQLNQQVGKVLANTASQNNIQSAQGLQNLVYQPQKGAENSQRGEMKEAMKTLKPQYEARTMERVESALKEVARAKDGKTISVRLDPPELGTLKIDMSLRDGSLHARVVAESPQVTTLLKEKSHELVQIMRKLGLNVEKVSVSVSDQKESFSGNLNGFDNSAQQFSDQRSGSERRSTSSGGRSSGHGSGDVLGQLRSATTVVDDHWVA